MLRSLVVFAITLMTAMIVDRVSTMPVQLAVLLGLLLGVVAVRIDLLLRRGGRESTLS